MAFIILSWTGAQNSVSASMASQNAAKTSEKNAKTSETNAQTYAEKAQQIKDSIASVYKACGSVNTYDDLPTEGVEIGDTYNILQADTAHNIKEGDNVAWTGESWDNLAGIVDLSVYATTQLVDIKDYAIRRDLQNGLLVAQKAAQDKYGNAIDSTYETVFDAQTLVETVSEQNGVVTVTTKGGTSNTFHAGINILARQKYYNEGDIVYSPNLPSWAYLECVLAGTTGYTEPDFSDVHIGGWRINDYGVVWELHDTLCKYTLGQIVPKVSGPKAHEHLLLCDGSAFDTAKYVQLAQIFEDGKLPNLVGRFLQGSNIAKQVVEAGLPNIIGTFFGYTWKSFIGSQRGAFIQRTENSATYVLSPSSGTGVLSAETNLNASYSNAIYGKSTTVQPPAYTVKYYICYGG
jgi:hypothetical protein